MQDNKVPSPLEIQNEIDRILVLAEGLEELHLTEETQATLRSILETNLEKGRVVYFIQGDIHLVNEYVQRIANNYTRLHDYLNKLQIARSNEVWGPLSTLLPEWASSFLQRKGYPKDDHTRDIALTCGNEAAIQILHAYFPYDTEIDAWLRVIVHHVCLKNIQKENTKKAKSEINFEDTDTELFDLSQPTLQAQVEKKLQQAAVLHAIKTLNAERRAVIELTYFEGLSPQEIAAKLNKSIGAVYNLRFNALNDLRKKLVTKGDNEGDGSIKNPAGPQKMNKHLKDFYSPESIDPPDEPGSSLIIPVEFGLSEIEAHINSYWP